MRGTPSRSSPERICIAGLGAIGSLLGFFLYRYTREPVHFLVRRPSQARLVNESGVALKGLIRGNYPVRAFTDLEEGECRYLVIAAKAHDAVKLVAQAVLSSEVVAVASNGFGALEECVKLEAKCLGVVVDYGVTRLGDNEFEVRGLGGITIGPLHRGSHKRYAGTLGSAFSRGGARVSVVDYIAPYRWLKASVNSSLNPITALLGAPNGVILDSPYLRMVAIRASREAGSIAGALGIRLPRDPVEYLLEVARRTKSNKSSMLQDLEACRSTEIEWINGYMARLAKKLGLDASTLELLYNLVKAKEDIVLSRCRSPTSEPR